MGLRDDYICNVCNIKYSCRQNLHRHNKHFHPINTPKCSIQEQNYSEKHQLGVKIVNNNETGYVEFFCDFCKKSFSRKYNLTRHLKLNRCLKLKDIENENVILKKENQEFKKELNVIKSQLLDVMNKQCKIHYKTLQKINNQLVNNNYNSFNNCTFNIVQLGNENLVEALSGYEQLKILKKKYQSLNYLVDYIHCNNKFPEFNNVAITNLQNNIAYMYDNNKKQFIATNKDELIDEIISYRMSDLGEFYDIHLDTLDNKTKKIISELLVKMENDDTYIMKKKDQIKLLVYNNKEKTIDKINIIK